MLFKHPEILYFLGLLIIPIIVHLFQLQRFEKTYFTNVAFLQKIIVQTRKSSQLKKWLLLLTRILLLSALIIAFAQPYIGTLKNKTSVFIYLDNSLSLSAKGTKGELLAVATNAIIKNSKENTNYSLLTNTNYYKNINASKLTEIAHTITPTSSTNTLKNSLFKIKEYAKKATNTVIISDFQNIKEIPKNSFPKNTTLVQVTPELQNNISIDSVAVTPNNNTNTLKVTAFIKNTGASKENIPLAIYNDVKLLSKQSFSISENTKKEVSFSVLNSPNFLGKLKLTNNDTYAFDNRFLFVVNSPEKRNILNIGKTSNYISKIFNTTEFNLSNSSLENLNYSSLNKQQLVIINEIEKISKSLSIALSEYTKKGGNLLIIPAVNTNISSYNSLFKTLKIGELLEATSQDLQITTIHYAHPVFKNVFNKRITNFQYPISKIQYKLRNNTANAVLSLENNTDFITENKTYNGHVFFVATPLNTESSNFTKSPLIVPTFYNIGTLNLQLPKLYYNLGQENTIAVAQQLEENNILKITAANLSFIPLQQAFQNKVKITTNTLPNYSDFYHIKLQEKKLKTIAFNSAKEESNLNFLNTKNNTVLTTKFNVSTSVENTLQQINSNTKVHWFSKWFLALAIVSLCLEILILKFLKP